jgi:hypothetical protein
VIVPADAPADVAGAENQLRPGQPLPAQVIRPVAAAAVQATWVSIASGRAVRPEVLPLSKHTDPGGVCGAAGHGGRGAGGYCGQPHWHKHRGQRFSVLASACRTTGWACADDYFFRLSGWLPAIR